jgi:hypothetical protein
MPQPGHDAVAEPPVNAGDQSLDPARVWRRLRLVRWLALADLVLLGLLLTASFTGQREAVRVLGPLHGINFVMLVTVVVTAAIDGLWAWWFPAAVLLTGGPPGALIGEWLIARRLRATTTGQATTAQIRAPD